MLLYVYVCLKVFANGPYHSNITSMHGQPWTDTVNKIKTSQPRQAETPALNQVGNDMKKSKEQLQM